MMGKDEFASAVWQLIRRALDAQDADVQAALIKAMRAGDYAVSSRKGAMVVYVGGRELIEITQQAPMPPAGPRTPVN